MKPGRVRGLIVAEVLRKHAGQSQGVTQLEPAGMRYEAVPRRGIDRSDAAVADITDIEDRRLGDLSLQAERILDAVGRPPSRVHRASRDDAAGLGAGEGLLAAVSVLQSQFPNQRPVRGQLDRGVGSVRDQFHGAGEHVVGHKENARTGADDGLARLVDDPREARARRPHVVDAVPRAVGRTEKRALVFERSPFPAEGAVSVEDVGADTVDLIGVGDGRVIPSDPEIQNEIRRQPDIVLKEEAAEPTLPQEFLQFKNESRRRNVCRQQVGLRFVGVGGRFFVDARSAHI